MIVHNHCAKKKKRHSHTNQTVYVTQFKEINNSKINSCKMLILSNLIYSVKQTYSKALNIQFIQNELSSTHIYIYIYIYIYM